MTTPCATLLLAALWLLPGTAAEIRDARKIQDRFVAPCCWQESVALHRSEVAAQMRAEIVGMVADGKSEDQIVEAYVARYGERVLQEPRGSLRIWLALIPVTLIILAVVWLLTYIRRQRRAQISITGSGNLPPLPDADLD